jgi:hypothetical protein
MNEKITEGYTGLMGAKEAIGKQLRNMVLPGTPFKYQKSESATETTITFYAHGRRATLTVKKGGE